MVKNWISHDQDYFSGFFILNVAILIIGILVCLCFQNLFLVKGWIAGCLIVNGLVFFVSKRGLSFLKKKDFASKKNFTFLFFYYILVYLFLGFLMYQARLKDFSFFLSFSLGLVSFKFVAIVQFAIIEFKKRKFERKNV